MEKIDLFKKQIEELESSLESNYPNFDEMDLYRLKKEMLLYKLSNPKDTNIDTLLSLTGLDFFFCVVLIVLISPYLPHWFSISNVDAVSSFLILLCAFN